MLSKETIAGFTEVLAAGAFAAIGSVIAGPLGSSCITDVGLNLVAAALQGHMSKFKQEWLRNPHGALNHDIQHAISRSLCVALARVEKKYFRLGQAYILPENEKAAIHALMLELQDQIKVATITPPALTPGHETLGGHGPADADRLLDDLSARLSNDPSLRDYPLHFREYFISQLPVELKICFAEDLKTDNPNSNKSWRAFQRLMLESIRAEVQALAVEQEVMRKDLEKLDRIEHELTRLADCVEKRDTSEPFQMAVTVALESLRDIALSTRHIEKDLHRLMSDFVEVRTDVKDIQTEVKGVRQLLKSSQYVGGGTAEPLMSEDLREENRKSNEVFLELLSQYSDHLPLGIRRGILVQIFDSLWETVAFQPTLASKLAAEMSLANGDLRPLLIPICKAALASDIAPGEACGFFRWIMNDQLRDDQMARQQNLMATRMLRFLLYRQPGALASAEVREVVADFSRRAEAYWQTVFSDLYFRHVCGYIELDPLLLEIVRAPWDKYQRECPGSVMARLWPFVSDPMSVPQHYTREAAIAFVKSVGHKCENLVEVRWTLSSLNRVLPLYEESDDGLEYSELLASLIESLPRALTFRSAQILFVYLRSLLRAFLKAKEVKHLAAYERVFCQMHQTLSLPEKSFLQLEYAAALHIALEFLETRDIVSLKFAEAIQSGTAPEHSPLLNTSLPFNIVVKAPLSLRDRRTVFAWLEHYLHMMYRVFADDLIRDDHLRALELRMTAHIEPVRSLLREAVLYSLRKHAYSSSDERPSFYARSTPVFDMVPRAQNSTLMWFYAHRSLGADRYTLVRQAPWVAKCLYSCHFYSEHPGQEVLLDALETFAGATMVGVGLPKLHWAYYAGIHFSRRPIEREFVEELWWDLQKLLGDRYSLLEVEDEFSTTIFSSEALAAITTGARKGSLFALVLSKHLSDPEVWNILGTTVFNHMQSGDRHPLEVAARFYYLASCFARTRREYDQKYTYNFVRCQSLVYQHSGAVMNEHFVGQVLRYLLRPGSDTFAYRAECGRPFFSLIDGPWRHLPADLALLFQRVKRVPWIRVELRDNPTYKRIGR